MAGIKQLDSTTPPIIRDYIVLQLSKPDLHQALFDDGWGHQSLSALLYSPSSVIYGIYSKGKPEPIGVVLFAGVVPFRDCVLYAAIFDKNQRKQGHMTDVWEKIKADVSMNYRIHSCTTYVSGRNPGSKKMLKKMGFEHIGIKKEGILAGGSYKDLEIHYLLLEKEAMEE